jgi:hypothetical protein
VNSVPRVAFFTDTFAETNGVALTSRQLEGFARRREYPFLCIKGALRTGQSRDGSVTSLELGRGPLSLGLDVGLRHDPFLWRHCSNVVAAMRAFRPGRYPRRQPGRREHDRSFHRQTDETAPRDFVAHQSARIRGDAPRENAWMDWRATIERGGELERIAGAECPPGVLSAGRCALRSQPGTGRDVARANGQAGVPDETRH